MNVWVLEAGQAHEGKRAIGVYESLEDAKAAIGLAKTLEVSIPGHKRYKPFCGVDYWEIVSFSVGVLSGECYPDPCYEMRGEDE